MLLRTGTVRGPAVAVSRCAPDRRVTELSVCLARGFDITCSRKVQSIIHQVQAALGGNVGWFIGWVILGLLTLHLAALCFGTFRRLAFEHEQRSRARARLREGIKAARVRCQGLGHTSWLW